MKPQTMLLQIILLQFSTPPDPIATYLPVGIAVLALVVQIYWNRRTLQEAQRNAHQQSITFQAQLANENENAFRYSSIQIATKFDEDFNNVTDERGHIGAVIIKHSALDHGLPEIYARISNDLSDIYDIFDTLGYFVRHRYIKAEVVHQYFYYWFAHYYAFFQQYSIRTLSGYDRATWNNLEDLSRQLDVIETAQQDGRPPAAISTADLLRFFKEEASLAKS